MENKSQSFDRLIEHWKSEIQIHQKEVNQKTLPAKISIGLGILFFCIGILFFSEYAWIGLLIFVAGIFFGIVLIKKTSKFRKLAVQKLSEEIQQESKNERLEKEDVVETLFEKTKGKVSQEVLRTVSPDTFALLNLRTHGQKIFMKVSKRKIEPMQINVSASSGTVSSVTIQGEEDIDDFASIAVDYLAHKGYVEGIASLAMVQMIYTEIAPPAGEVFIHAWQSNQALKDVAIQAHKIMSDFDFTPEMKFVKETLAKLRTRSILEQLLLTKQKHVGQDDASLSAVIDATSLKIRDEAFIGACIDYIGQHTTDPFKKNKAYSLIAQIPDARTLPYLMEAFKQFFFFPQGIEAVAILGKETHPKLSEALRMGSDSLRFNAALALGFMNLKSAKPVLEEVLPTIKDPKERVGVCYALVHFGDKNHLNTIEATFDHSDKDVRHAAAIALEHLSESLDDKFYLKHLEDENMLVRLRLTRKLGVQSTKSSLLIDALVKRFDDASKEVRTAAIKAIANLDAELVYDRMVEIINNGIANPRLCAFEVLGSLSQSKAIPILTNALSKTYDKDVLRTVLSALGSLSAVDSVNQIVPYLDDDELSSTAFWALLQISLKDKEIGTKHLDDRKHSLKKHFLLSIHGDEKAKDQIKKQLHSSKDFVELIHAMEYAQILRDPDFEQPFRQLLKYRNPNRFPGDRYISYMALKGLVQIQMAKA